MVSTYLSYDLVNRDMTASLKRISSQTQVANDQAYYQANIGKVTTVDEFLDDYRLYSFAMTAHGLGEMTYAKAFMKQVLESDLSDDNSFANRLTDERYTTFAAAFNFGGVNPETAVAQSAAQIDDVVDFYNQQISALEDKTQEDTRYFNVMFGEGNISSVDQFLRNDRLREYVFTAYGIDGTYYNYTAIKGALTSDLSDPNSYFNTAFAPRLATYNAAKTEDSELAERLSAQAAIPTYEQSISLGQQRKADFEAQIEAKRNEMNSGGDQQALQAEIDALQVQLDETDALIAKDQTNLTQTQARFDELDARLVPIDQTSARRTELSAIMRSQSSGIAYYQQLEKLAQDFQFNADGSVPEGGALTESKRQDIVADYFEGQERVTRAEAMFNQDYFESKIASITTVDDLLADDRIYQYLRTAFDLDEPTVVRSTLDQILTSDLSDPNSYANRFSEQNPQYLVLANAFNFGTDGTVAAGGAQTTAQTTATRNDYLSRWNDQQEEDLDRAITFYKSDMAAVKNLDDFLSSDAQTTYEFALDAVGIDPSSVSKFMISRVLQSDLSDPNSYVYTLDDERFLSLAKLFNFDSDGEVTNPVLAQSNTTITNVAKDYILRQTRHLEGDELEAARTKAEEDSKYYTDTMQGLDNRTQLLADRKLLDVILISEGIDPETITNDFLEQIFTSDINDPESFVNQQDDKRFAQIVGSFNFDADGEIDRAKGGAVQNGGEIVATQSMYLRQLLETEQGNDNAGVRLALYFQRMADTITDPYVILGDDALAEFFRVTFSLPTEFSNMDVDAQAKVVEKNLNLEDLSDPAKLNRLIERFTALYDLENNSAFNSPAVSILNGSNGSAGISADTLWALAQLGGR